MKILFTGGHHSSALPVIEKLQDEYPETEILWIGQSNTLKDNKNKSLEYNEITGLGIPFYDLKAGKLYKTFNLQRLIKIPIGLIQSFFLLLKLKPDVILSFGGYVAAPVVISGWFLGIPSVTHEQTVVVGYANKLISKFAKKILISWESSEKYFNKNKIVYSGLPVRKSIFNIKSNSFVTSNNLPTIYITAGKTGSHLINSMIKECLAKLLSFCNVIHQCGDNSVYNDFDNLEGLYKEIESVSIGKYFLRRFIYEDEIGEAMGISCMLVSRAGAHTTTEILALEKPAIMIPIPWVSHDEQNKNAQMLEELGLAKILKEDGLNSDLFVNEVRDFLYNIEKYKLNNSKARDLVNKEAVKIIIDETFKASKKS